MTLKAFATESCRRAPPTTTLNPQPYPGRIGMTTANESGESPEPTTERHDDLVHARMVAERRDTALEDGNLPDFEQLFRHAGAKPEAGAAGSDDGSDVHEL